MFRPFQCLGGGAVGSEDDPCNAETRVLLKREDPPPTEIDTPSILGNLSSVSSHTAAVQLQRRQSVEENSNRAEHRGDESDRHRGHDPPPSVTRDATIIPAESEHRSDGVPIVNERMSTASSRQGSHPSLGGGSCDRSQQRSTLSRGNDRELPKLGNDHLLHLSNRVEEYMGPLRLEDTATRSEHSSRSNHLHLLADRVPSSLAANLNHRLASDDKSLSSREFEIRSAAASSRHDMHSSTCGSNHAADNSRSNAFQPRQEETSQCPNTTTPPLISEIESNLLDRGGSAAIDQFPKKQEEYRVESDSSFDRIFLVKTDMSSLSSCSGYQSRSKHRACRRRSTHRAPLRTFRTIDDRHGKDTDSSCVDGNKVEHPVPISEDFFTEDAKDSSLENGDDEKRGKFKLARDAIEAMRSTDDHSTTQPANEEQIRKSLLSSVSSPRQIFSPTSKHDSWDERGLREKSSVPSRAAYSENDRYEPSSGQLASLSAEHWDRSKESRLKKEETFGSLRAEQIEEAAWNDPKTMPDRLSLVRDAGPPKLPSRDNSAQISRAALSENSITLSERKRTTHNDRMTLMRSNVLDDQSVHSRSYSKTSARDEFSLPRARIPDLASSTASLESGLMTAMKNAPVNSYENSDFARVSFADELTDNDSSSASSVGSCKDREIVYSNNFSPTSRSILKTRNKVKNSSNNSYLFHVAFSDNLTDSDDSSSRSTQRLSIEEHLRDKRNKNHLLNYQPWIDRRIIGEIPDARALVSSSSTATRPRAPPIDCANSIAMADSALADSSRSSQSKVASASFVGEGVGNKVPFVVSARLLTPGVPIVTADSITNIPVVEAESVSTGTLQQTKSRLQPTAHPCSLRCEGPPPTDIAF